MYICLPSVRTKMEPIIFRQLNGPYDQEVKWLKLLEGSLTCLKKDYFFKDFVGDFARVSLFYTCLAKSITSEVDMPLSLGQLKDIHCCKLVALVLILEYFILFDIL